LTEIANGWALYNYQLFAEQLTTLKAEVASLARTDPTGYKAHPKTKLLASVYDSIRKRVPADPAHKDFRQGKTLGVGNGHWRRVKKGMPNRYRLFFRFNSAPPIIIYTWMNNEGTLRKAGSKSDCYEVFRKMLQNGVVPDNLEQLLKAST
jgi:toxin YhaV